MIYYERKMNEQAATAAAATTEAKNNKPETNAGRAVPFSSHSIPFHFIFGYIEKQHVRYLCLHLMQ